MPCDQVILNSVEFTAVNQGLTVRSIKDTLGVEAFVRGDTITFFHEGNRYVIADKQLTGDGTEQELGALADRLRQGVSHVIVKQAASKFGWTLKKKAGVNAYGLTKRAM